MNELDKKVTSLLNEIRNMCGLFIGKPSLTLLKAFIDGYLCSQDRLFSCNIMSDFQSYVEVKYDIDTNNWARIIEFYSVEEKEAFDTFYKLFDEFLEESNLRVK